MSKLCLVDASGYLHRAFHALPYLSTSKGEPVNALYGFSRMVSKILKTEKPDFVAVCFDTPVPTFRHTQYKAYKATREKPDDNLLFQLPLAEALVKAWGFPCLKMDGYEADDVIATLARMGQKGGFDVLILSGDKDTLQLIRGSVRVRDDVRNVDYDAAKVKERYGVEPEQLIDLFCLMGDKTDNVAGVPGVGEKTAAKLLAEHGSLEKIYKSLNGTPSALRENLLKYKDTVFSNRTLIQLKEDVPLETPLESLKWKKPDPAVLAPLLQRLEFRSGLYGAEEISVDAAFDTNKSRHVQTVTEKSQLDSLRDRLQHTSLLSYDLETDGLNPLHCSIVGVALSVKKDEAWYIPVGHAYLGAPAQLSWPAVKAVIQPALENPNIRKLGQNIKFDNAILKRHGIEVRPPTFDTMVAAYCLDPSRPSYSLKDLAPDTLGERMVKIDELLGEDGNFASVLIEKAAPYAGADAEVVVRLTEILEKKLRENNLTDLFEKMEMPLVDVIQAMETAGIKIDADYLKDIGRKFEADRKALETEIFNLAGEEFLVNSTKQLGRILFDKLKLPVIRKTKTGFSTDEEVLLKLVKIHPIGEKVLAYRELAKLISTYVGSVLELVDPATSRVHTSFNQTGTATGRLSSSEPNLQNIPIRTEHGREIRRAFVAEKGHLLVSADYSQIDLRALAHVSEDPLLMKIFKSDGDVHMSTAAEIFHVPFAQVTNDMRQKAKAINFGIVYGQQAYGLSQSIGISLEDAQRFISATFERYAGVKAWIDRTLADARKTGAVTTLSGRRRPVRDINSSNGALRGAAERIAINTPIQGSSADIIKAAMIKVYNDLKKNKLKTQMLVQVHDDLLFEVPEVELEDVLRLIKKDMEEAMELRVPLRVDMKSGRNWNDMTAIHAQVPS
ncbi:MAG: DNA polymerase I [Elusimicrobia bacterium]|nr:DNA polymerase I [Candidatus Obscuribacterium magneticum]